MSGPGHVHTATCGCQHDVVSLVPTVSLRGAIEMLRTNAWNACNLAREENRLERVFVPADERPTPRIVAHAWDRVRAAAATNRAARNEALQLVPGALSNEDDPELLMYIPFTSTVKLHSFVLMCAGDTAPTKVKIFVNRQDVDLSNVGDVPCAQEIDLAEDEHARIVYPVKVNKFQNVSSLTLYFPSSVGGEQTHVYWLELRGVASKDHRGAITNVVYESVAQPQDHPVESTQQMSRHVE